MAILIADTTSGKVRGIRGNNPSFTVFKGIPYAAPPIGDLRFREPVAHEPWDGELLCDDFGPTPIENLTEHIGDYAKEFYSVQMPMSEDCLRLHIWTPAQSTDEKLPVMIWCHGGGYSRGYSYEMEFDGEAICKRGCILVSVGYRVGALGFLAHPYLSQRSSSKKSGNYGIFDQIFALKWVQKNIEAFGGNPDNVTIFGQSAGGGAMRTLLATTMARGLFHRTIVQSAGGIGQGLPEGYLNEDEEMGEKLVEALGWSPEELLTRPAEDIYFKLLEQAYKEGVPMLFRPTVDGYLLNESVNESICKGNVAQVPIMCGAVSGDGARKWDEYQNNSEFENCKKLVAAADTIAWGYVYGKQDKNPVYSYLFSRTLPGGDEFGANTFHTSELWYTFGTLYRCWRPFTGLDYELSSAMTDYWTNFAKNGNPNGEGLPQWRAFSPETPDTMTFGDDGIQVQNYLENTLINKIVQDNIVSSGIVL